MRAPLQEIRNVRIDCVTDAYGNSGPLSGWRVDRYDRCYDLNGLYVDADGAIYVDSKTDGLMSKEYYEKKNRLRFRVSGNYGAAAAPPTANASSAATNASSGPITVAEQRSTLSTVFAKPGKANSQIPGTAHYAAVRGADSIRAFAAAGGKFTDERDYAGQTAAHHVVIRLVGGQKRRAMKAFVAAGGTFIDQQDMNGNTPAILAAHQGPDAVSAFAEAGGKFSDKQDRFGDSAAHIIAHQGADAIRAFAAAGGKFIDQKNADGDTAAMLAAGTGAYWAKQAACHYEGHRPWSAAERAASIQAFEEAMAAQKKAELAQAPAEATTARPTLPTASDTPSAAGGGKAPSP